MASEDTNLYSGLGIELDSYTAFFKRRAEVEAEYADSLKKLYYKQSELDRRLEEDGTSRDSGIMGMMSWKRVYLEIRGNLLDESKAHEELAHRTRRVMGLLSEEKEKKDRTRRRIKEDLRAASTEHMEYIRSVQRLRKTYEAKVDEIRASEEAETHSDSADHWAPPSDSSASSSGRDRRDSSTSNPRSSSGSGGGGRDSPPLERSASLHHHSSVSPPSSVVFVSGATSSSHHAPSAYRDAPTAKPNNVFEQIAKRDWNHDKHRVHSMVRAVGNLGKGDGGGGGGSQKGAKSKMSAGKLKREAEQADRDYRDGIFRLETLRLQRERMIRSAACSSIEFVGELSTLLRRAFGEHLYDLDQLARRWIDDTQKIGPSLQIINPSKDAEFFAERVREPAPEPRVYYQNAFVGECRTLLFGVSLTDYLSTHPNQLVPLIVKMCIAQIEAGGINVEGIYRIPGKLATVQQLVHSMEKDEIAFAFDGRTDPAAIAGVLKLYIRQLPTPLFHFPAPDRLAFSQEYHTESDNKLSQLGRRLRRLSPAQQATLKALCAHLSKVADRSDVNKMTPSNLGTVFTPAVFGDEETVTIESAMHASQDVVMELLIVHHATLFIGLPLTPETSASSRPLSPPTPQSQSGHATPHLDSLAARDMTSPLIPYHSRQTSDRRASSSSSPDRGVGTMPSPPLAARRTPSDTMLNLYRQGSTPLPPHDEANRTESPLDTLNSPTPPLSAAGGRQIPPYSEEVIAQRRAVSRSSSGSTPLEISLPHGWDGASPPQSSSSGAMEMPSPSLPPGAGSGSGTTPRLGSPS